MEQHRIKLKRIEDAYCHEIARLLLYEIRDPRLHRVRITQVRITPDMTLARVYFDTPEGKIRETEVFKALKHSKGFLKKGLATAVRIRRMPDLEFFYDETGDLEKRVEEIFKHLDQEHAKKEDSSGS